MKFYRVKPIADQKRIDRPKKSWFLVANELISEKEAKKEGITELLTKYAELVSISKFNTHWFFGCRFENKLTA